MSDESINPIVSEDDIFEGATSGSTTYAPTPVGSYRMALAGNLTVKKTKAGEKKLVAFFKHTEAKGLKGVNLEAMLEGVDKNGNAKSRAVAQLLYALGVSKTDAAAVANRTNGSEIRELESFDSLSAEEQWKGVPAAIIINGDTVDLKGREASIKVEAGFKDPAKTVGKAAYKI